MGRPRLGALAPFLVVAACGGEPPVPAGGPSASDPLVIESPHLDVLAGPDTLEVFVPTVFAYFAAPAATVEPTPAQAAAAGAFQATLDGLAPGLEAMGVRLVIVGEPPRALGVAPEVDAAAGPRLPEGGAGFLLAEPGGGIRRLERTTGVADLLCSAARLFQRQLPPRIGVSCP